MTKKIDGGWNELCKCQNGPGSRDLKKAVEWLVSCGDPRIDQSRRSIPILWFGTTKSNYRSFPIRLTGISLREDGKFNLEGCFHYPRNQKGSSSLNGNKAKITGYDSHKRTAEKMESFVAK